MDILLTDKNIDWRQVRAAYEGDRESVRAICRRFRIAPCTLYRRRAAEGWRWRGKRVKAKRPRQAASQAMKPPPVPSRRVSGAARLRMVDKLFRTCAMQIDEIEARLAQKRATGDVASEQETRTLASLVRSIEKIMELDAQARTAYGRKKTATSGHHTGRTEPWRQRLAERLVRFNEEAGGDGEVSGLA